MLLTRPLPLLLMMILSGCRSNPRHISEQCSPVFVYVDESQKLIDVDSSFCSVRQYEFSLQRVGAINGTSSKRPLPYCDRCIGFRDYAATASFWERVRRAIQDEEFTLEEN